MLFICIICIMLSKQETEKQKMFLQLTEIQSSKLSLQEEEISAVEKEIKKIEEAEKERRKEKERKEENAKREEENKRKKLEVILRNRLVDFRYYCLFTK